MAIYKPKIISFCSQLEYKMAILETLIVCLVQDIIKYESQFVSCSCGSIFLVQLMSDLYCEWCLILLLSADRIGNRDRYRGQFL